MLAATTYCKLEHRFFEEAQSRPDVATAFKCNTSQITKMITGIIYKSGPHHYIPKKQCDEASNSATKHAGDPTDPNLAQTKNRRMMTPTLSEPSMSKAGQQFNEMLDKDDTLSTESSSSGDLPLPSAF